MDMDMDKLKVKSCHVRARTFLPLGNERVGELWKN